MFRRILSLVRKELIQVFRNRITLALTMVSPVVQLLIFGYVAIIDVNNVPTAILDHSNSAQSRRLASDLFNSGYFRLDYTLRSEDQIVPLIDGGSVDLVIVIPPDFEKKIATGEKTEIQGIIDGSDSNTAITVGNYFNGVAIRYSANVVTSMLNSSGAQIQIPLDFRPRVYFNSEMKTLFYLVPGIIAVLVMMLLVMLSAIGIVREREQGTFEQLNVTPIRIGELLVGKTLPFALLGYMTTLIITAVGILWFRVPFRGDFLLLMAIAGLYMLTALGLGIFVSSLAQTQQQVLMLSMFVIVPQLLLSGFIFPIESMPDIMQYITLIIPARYFLIIIRGIFLKAVGFAELIPEILALSAFAAIIFSLAALRFSRRAQI